MLPSPKRNERGIYCQNGLSEAFTTNPNNLHTLAWYVYFGDPSFFLRRSILFPEHFLTGLDNCLGLFDRSWQELSHLKEFGDASAQAILARIKSIVGIHMHSTESLSDSTLALTSISTSSLAELCKIQLELEINKESKSEDILNISDYVGTCFVSRERAPTPCYLYRNAHWWSTSFRQFINEKGSKPVLFSHLPT